MPFNLFAPSTWLSGFQSTPPPVTGLFQTRVTHTPGGFGQVGAGTAGGYLPNIDPRQVAAAQPNLTPQERTTLAQSMPAGQGFILMPPGDIRPDVIRHEQIHDLMAKSGALQHAGNIAPLVDPRVTDIIKESPVYQQEMKQFGPENVIADEGTAINLINLANMAGGPNDALRTKVMQFLKNKIQQRQFQKLVDQSRQ